MAIKKVYPPIFVDETLMNQPRVSEKEKFRLGDTTGARGEITVSPKAKTLTHISLGNDEVLYESVTKSSLKAFGDVEFVKHNKADRKRSTVLDHPDMETGPMETVHQQGIHLSTIKISFLKSCPLF